MPRTSTVFRLRPRQLLITGAAVVAATAIALAPQRAARAQLAVIDPTNLVQNIISAIQSITEVAQQVEQLSNEASQIVNQVSMLQDMANQASQLGSPTWGQVEAWINNLAAAAQFLRHGAPSYAYFTSIKSSQIMLAFALFSSTKNLFQRCPLRLKPSQVRLC